MSDDKHDFSPEKIFIWLFIFTAAEVAWGYIGHAVGMTRLPLWGGLIGFALAKGWLILVYFMHFKYEGWIVKGLIAPTPFLVCVILFVLRPDVSDNDKMDYPIGARYVVDPAGEGVMINMGEQDKARSKDHKDEEEDDANGGH